MITTPESDSLPNDFSNRLATLRRLAAINSHLLSRQNPDGRISTGRWSKDEEIFLSKAVVVLTHPQLQDLITRNRVTLGAIRPNAHHGQNLPNNDIEAAEFLLDIIGRDNILLNLSLKLTMNEAELFYCPLRERQIQIQPLNNGPFANLWEQLMDISTAGSTSFFLYQDIEGNAVDKLRRMVGKWPPSQAEPGTIRRVYALDSFMPNTLVHSSDSVHSVFRELGVVINILKSL